MRVGFMKNRITGNKGVLGGVLGALITLTFSLGSMLLLNDFSLDFLLTIRNLPLGLIILLMAPIAGGFSAGMIGQDYARQAGLIAGVGASLVVFIAWLLFSWGAWEEVLSGLVIGFVWIFLSHLGSGFASHK